MQYHHSDNMATQKYYKSYVSDGVTVIINDTSSTSPTDDDVRDQLLPKPSDLLHTEMRKIYLSIICFVAH